MLKRKEGETVEHAVAGRGVDKHAGAESKKLKRPKEPQRPGGLQGLHFSSPHGSGAEAASAERDAVASTRVPQPVCLNPCASTHVLSVYKRTLVL